MYITMPPRGPAGNTDDEYASVFDHFVAQHLASLYRFAVGLSGSTAVAAELVRETLMRAWKRRAHLGESAQSADRLVAILRELHGRQRSPAARDLTARHPHFAHVPLTYREPLLLQMVYGYSQAQLAEHFDVPLECMATRLAQARVLMEGAA